MAEKPRLKKSNEILGSIAVEPKRAAKKGRSGASEDSEKERRARGATAPVAKTPEPTGDFDDELESPDQQVILPSAQSLAEKLLAHEDKRKRLNFEKYELPKREQKPARPAAKEAAKENTTAQEREAPETPTKPARAARENTAARAGSRAEVPAPAAAAQHAQIEFSPPPSASAQFEFGEPEASANGNPAVADQPAPRPQRHGRAAAPRQATAAAPVPEPPPATVVSEYMFTSFDDEPASTPNREFSIGQGEPDENRRPRERSRRIPQPENENIAASTEEAAFIQAAPEQPRIILPQQPRQEDMEQPPAEAKPTAHKEPAPEPRPEPETERLSDDDRHHREFLDRISSQFDLQFEEKFGQGALKERGKAQPLAIPTKKMLDTPAPRKAAEPVHYAAPEPPQDEDFFGSNQRQPRGTEPPDERPLRGMFEESGAASSFIEQFAKETQDEELERKEDFKETLAEKFERERERYLKELEISRSGNEPPAQPEDIEDIFSAPPPQRRKLDFQIQPEMHTQAGVQGAAPPRAPSAAGPVTYTRGGMARPQVPVTGDAPAEPPMAKRPAAAPAGGSARKKTSEELLMELGQRGRNPAPANKAAPQKPLKFTFAMPEDQAKAEKDIKPAREPLLPKEKWPRRIVLIAMAAGLLSIALLAWPVIKYIQFSNSFADTPETTPSAAPFNEDTLEVYEDRSFEQTASVNNVLFKNSNVTLKNASVSDYVIVDGVLSAGKVRLEDVRVGAAVSVKGSGITALELVNVDAERVIINNPSAEMTVSVSGSTDIGMFEVRTPTTVQQFDISGNAAGVRSMTLTPAEGEALVSAKLNGLSLTNLFTAAENSVITFENGTNAETMSSDGSLSLSGSGRVANLSIGAATSQGAGESDARGSIIVLIKDIPVTNLSVKSPANLNLVTHVDNVTTSYPLSIGGSGSVGTLTINQRPDSSRLPVDIAGLSIQSVYANAQARVNITGSAKVNVFTADASVYILGNKVNRLIANADDVIYEHKPDQIAVADNVRNPQSVADNPHIDYNAGSGAPGSLPLAASDSSTSCGHSTESGGFTAGNGSKDSPFEVYTALQLAHVAAHPDSCFIQTADIDIAAENAFANGFSPICSTGVPFSGQYDGRGYSISNLKITSSDEGTGLFGANKGVIQNLRILSGEISSTAATKAYVGAVAGVNLEGGSIRSCSNGAAVSGNQYTYTGGIAGLNTGGKVHDCYNYGKVSGVDGVGGLVGVNDGGASITGSYNAGELDGRDYTGSVTGSNSTGSTVANCYYLEETALYGIAGGNGTATEKTADELASPQAAADLAAGNESSLWITGGGNGYPYPTHRAP